MVESDSDALWTALEPPLLPRLRDRRKAAELLHARGVALSVTVSPCARLADPDEFAGWIAANSGYAVVDTFTAGDGKGGTRTEKTSIPLLFATHGWIRERRDRRQDVVREGSGAHGSSRGMVEGRIQPTGRHSGWAQGAELR